MTSTTGPGAGAATTERAKTVRMRVTKKGHGLIFTGEIDPKTNRPTKYDEGEEFDGPAENFEMYQERGIAVPAAPAPPPQEPPRITNAPLPATGDPPVRAATEVCAKTVTMRITKKGHGVYLGPEAGRTDRSSSKFSEGEVFETLIKNCQSYERLGVAVRVAAPPQTAEAIPAQNSADAPSGKIIDAEAMARLAARALRDETTGCLVWQGSKAHGGYGQITYRRQLQTTHRLAWIAQRGPVPGNTYVCHACDNPACIAIEHLFLGTPQDNYRDMRRKGRSRYNSKLETHQVAAIKRRLAQGEPAVQIAKDYAVRYDQILNIKRGVAWREVTAEETG